MKILLDVTVGPRGRLTGSVGTPARATSTPSAVRWNSSPTSSASAARAQTEGQTVKCVNS